MTHRGPFQSLLLCDSVKCLLDQIVKMMGLEGVGSNRFPNMKKIPSPVKPTLEKCLFSIYSSRGVSENLLVFGRTGFTKLVLDVVLPRI